MQVLKQSPDTSESQGSPFSEESHFRSRVKLERFDIAEEGQYACRLISETHQTLLDGILDSKEGCSVHTMGVVHQAIHLSKQRHSSLRSTFNISKSEGLRYGEQTLGLDLCVRILVKDFQTMADSIAMLDRGKALEACLPRELAVRQVPFSPRDFYDNVYVPDRNTAHDLPVVKELQCELLPFQRRAIRWLMQREAINNRSNCEGEESELPHGFVRAIDGDGRPCFISRFLGVATTARHMVGQLEPSIRGGILAEEMGLGKTVEMIGLMCLHRQAPLSVTDQSSTGLPRTPATLVITPPVLSQQWKQEMETLAPALKVCVYDGLKVEAHKADHEELLRRFLTHDVVLTTFPVLAKEIHYAESTDRPLRHEKRYEKRLSPLTRVLWWRVILDEAQMLESGVSNAAKVANMIPRENAWCVTGTPVKKDSNDILGLLLFLRHQPYCSLPKFWSRLVTEHKDVFKQTIRKLALRHTKEQIKDEIGLPAQKRVVITVPFTHIEEQHYSTMFQEMAEDCGLDVNGGPLADQWDPDAQAVVEKMRTWLTRLRQTCLHPEVGARNRRALGGRGPLRTVSEVLEVMIEQNHTAARTEERVLLMSQLRRGQILEHAECTQDALNIWLAALKEVVIVVQECRDQLSAEMQRMRTADPIAKVVGPEDEDDDPSSRLGPYRMRLRAALEFEHGCTFFAANAYFQLKTKEKKACLENAQTLDSTGKPKTLDKYPANETSTGSTREVAGSKEERDGAADNNHTSNSDDAQELQTPKSARYCQLEQLEEAAYERAKTLRKEILQEARKKADGPINKIKEKAKSMVEIPAITGVADARGGIDSRQVIEKLEALVVVMQDQTRQIIEWRKKTIDLLTVPLVDEAEEENLMDSEVAGKEYENSTKQQDQCYVYIDAFRALVSDRHDILTGQENLLIDHEMKVALSEAKENRGHAPQLLCELLQQRQDLKPTKEVGSVRALLTELRELKTTLRAGVERQNSRAAAEHIIINSAMMKLQQISRDQSKVVTALDKEVELFKEAMNLRLNFYRQLQAISDAVAPYEHNLSVEDRENVLRNKENHEDYLRGRVATLKSKGRYLLHLREEATDTVTERICIICKDQIVNGILTSCGHIYCVECLQFWWGTHRNCPTCKKHLRKQDFHNITYKPSELSMEEEAGPSAPTKDCSTDDTKASGIYSGIREPILNQIKDIDIDGAFGTKIDTIARHIFWIRQHDPGAKSIIFSQYKDFLDVLHRAFTQFKIGCTSIDKKGGIQSFKNDPGIECFFLHAKAHSSGLNLVNATHVFLCEPLINTAIELQAIARVHRIGQRHETTIWMYLVEGTVEKSIYDISVQRRLAHMGQLHTKEASRDGGQALEETIEAANSLELEDAPISALLTKGSSGGEMVPQEDLWDCLFRLKPVQPERVSQNAHREVARHLGADAAGARIRDCADTPSI